MSAGSERLLWTIAATASFGLHGMIALALAYAPTPEADPPTVTRIDLQAAATAALPVVEAAASAVAVKAPTVAASLSQAGEAPDAAPVEHVAAIATPTTIAAVADDHLEVPLSAPTMAEAAEADSTVTTATDNAALEAPSDAVEAAAVESFQASQVPATVAAVGENDTEAPLSPDVAEAAEAASIAPTATTDIAAPEARSNAIEAMAIATMTAAPREVAAIGGPVAAPRQAEAVVVTRRPQSRRPAAIASPASPAEAGPIAAGTAAAGAAVAFVGPAEAAASAGPAAAVAASSGGSVSTASPFSVDVTRADAVPSSAASVAVGTSTGGMAAVPAPSPAARRPHQPATPAQPARQRLSMVWPREPPAPVDMTAAYSDVLASIRLRRGGSCLAAWAVLTGESIRIDGFAAGTAASAGTLATEHAARLIVRDHRVSRAQCAALDFARSAPGYPEPGLSVGLAAAAIDSGEPLSGIISGMPGGWLYLLIVDDEGKVQELKDLEAEADAVSFRAPLTLTGGPVGTVQLLLALASDAPLDSVARNEGAPAELYFPPLRAEVAQAGAAIRLALVPFVLR